MPIETAGFAAPSATEPLKQFKFQLRDVGPHDVHIQVKYCGVCHSDLHQARNQWGNSSYPMVPGHEIVGVVKSVGSAVSNFKPGDRVGVGCFVESCRECERCKAGEEQYCLNGVVLTYNSHMPDGTPNYGGYARDVVVTERFVVHIPDGLELDKAAPLLCAGITLYSPMKLYGMDMKGKKIGVLGLGGLGHMGVKFAVMWGNEVTVLSRSQNKEKDAREMGATKFLITTDPEQMKAASESLDFILDTVGVGKDYDAYLQLLKVDGAIVALGVPDVCDKSHLSVVNLVFKRRRIGGSLVGGIPQTQEMLNLCAAKKVDCMIEKIPMDKINDAYERMLKSDVKYRFVIDVDGTAPKA